MNEQSKDILEISAILFKNNVPIEEAQVIARYIGQLLGENKTLKKELESLKSSDEDNVLREEIKNLCKKIKQNEKSRRKMQQSLMTKIQQKDNIINNVKEVVENKFLQTWLESYVSLKTEDYLKLKEILNIDKGEK